jgi:hypothetical protein
VPKRYYTLKPQITPLPSAGKGVLPSAAAARGKGVRTGAGDGDGLAAGTDSEASVTDTTDSDAVCAAGINKTGSAGASKISKPTPAGPGSNSDQPANDPFIRAEAEDDDGYDPYSDRPPTPEPTFQEDPWR